MEYKYSMETGENMAKAAGLALPISLKKSVEVCNLIRGKGLNKSIAALNRVAKDDVPVPYRRFNRGGTGHRPGIGPGRYPKKTCVEIVRILEDAKANAEHHGLSSDRLFIRHISAKKASKSFHYGRKRRRLMKRTHIEVVVEESKEKVKK